MIPSRGPVTLPRILVASLCALAAPCLLAATGATQAGPVAPPPIERVTSELVLIETYVTDVHGREIAGLKPDDFVLMIDGQVRPIGSLEYVSVGSPTPAASFPPIPETPGSQLQRRIVLFFDDASSVPLGMVEARGAAAGFVAQDLAPTDEVAIVAFDGSVRIVHDFTTDRHALAQAILDDRRQLRSRPTGLDFNSQAMEIWKILGDDTVAKDTSLRKAARTANGYAAQSVAILRRLLAALRSTTDALATLPGYKAIVLLGDGVPENTAAEYFSRLGGDPTGAGLGRHGMAEMQLKLDRILRESLRIDAANDLSPEVRDLREAMAAGTVTLATIQTMGGISVHRTDELTTTTRDTGGISASTRDLRGALRGVEAVSRSYYLMGYVPEGPPDGRYHAVTVRLRKTSGNLSWRRGFVRLDPSAAQDRSIRAALVVPEMYPDPGLEVSLVDGPVVDAAATHDVTLHIAPGKIFYLPESGHRTARLTVGIVAVDASGAETLREVREVQVRMQPTRGLNLVSRIQLPAGRQTLTAVVGDRTAGTTGAARIAIDPEPAAQEAVFGLAVYSLAEESLWIDLPATLPDPVAESSTKSTIGPALKGTFAPGEPLVCGFQVKNRSDGTIPSFRVVVRRGEEILGTREAVAARHRPSGAMEAGLPVDQLPAGDYVVTVQELVEGAPVDRAEVPLRLHPNL
jgi:VWFA-related protein